MCSFYLASSNQPILTHGSDYSEAESFYIEAPAIFSQYYQLKSTEMKCLIAYSDSMFGVAKLMCDTNHDSDEEFDDIEVDLAELPIYLKEPVKQEKPVWIASTSI
jgi:hypothetical protein